MLRPASQQSHVHASKLTVAVAVAAGLNSLDLEVVGGVRVFLGAFAIMPLVLSRGPVWAVLASLLAMLPSVLVLGHPFALGLAGLEAAWLVLGARYFRRNVILVDGAFWLCVGLPLGLWWYGGLIGLPQDLALVVLATKAAVGLAAVSVAYFILRYTTVGAKLSGRQAETDTVREVIFDYVFVLSLVPLGLVALGFAVLSRGTAEAEARERAFLTARDAVRQIDLFVELHQSALAGAARIVERSPAATALVLEETQRAHTRFVTMLVTDAAGRIVQTAPGDQLARLQGTSVADREYFRVARDLRRPFVSGVFRGRGFGSDILVAMSVPMFGPDGGFTGIVEASVQVERLTQTVAALGVPDQIQLVLADAVGRVIFADEQTGLRPLQSLQDSSLAPAFRPRIGVTPFPADRIEPDGTKRRVSNLVQQCRTVGITVLVQWPVLNELEGMKTAYVLMAVILLGVGGSAVFVARAAQRRLSAPLEHFSGAAARQARAGAVAQIPTYADKIPREVADVFDSFNHLAVRLEATHAELRQHNAELDRRVAERTHEAESARHQAEAASRSKTDFLAMASHELRTPLNAIIGLADAVAADPVAPLARTRLHTIREAGAGLLGVVNDLLDLSRAEAGKLELHRTAVDIGSLCGGVRALLALRAEQRGLQLVVSLPPDLPMWVETDGPRLQQVLINLIGNALKFTATGGVTLRVERVGPAGPEVEWRFAVSDTGPGIPLAEQEKLFEPYVQLAGGASSSQPGTGLGLSISRRLVALLGGELALRSAPGEGAEFFFSLRARAVAPPVPLAAAAGQPAAEKLRVLAADDNAANRDVLAAMLEGHCSYLEIVDSGAEALRVLRAGRFDVALIDLNMPDLDGLAVARMIRSWSETDLSQPCRLVAFSAHGRAQMGERCAAAGFDDFVEKPIDRRDLLRAVTTRARPAAPVAGA